MGWKSISDSTRRHVVIRIFFFFNQPEITDLPMQEEVTHRGAERAAFRSNDKQRTRVNALITGFANFI